MIRTLPFIDLASLSLSSVTPRGISRALLLLSASTAMSFSSAAFAQTSGADDEADNDDIIVIATGQSRAMSASKMDTPIIESPQTISIINREEMDVRAVATVSDAVAYTAGVRAEAQGIDSRTDEISLRGFGAGGFSSNNNFIDGLRLPSGGQWTRTQFDPFALDQIEVLKGPSSILYGQSAPGGIINMVSKRANAKGGGEVMLAATGFNELGRRQYQGALDFGGALNSSGTLSARIVGLAKDGDTQIDHTSNSRYYISPSLTWEPNDRLSWTILAQYQRDEGGSTYQFLPMTGTLNPSNGERIAHDAFLGEPEWNKFDRNQYLIGSFVKVRLSDALTFRSNTRYTKVDTLYRAIVLLGDTITNCSAPPYTSPLYAGCVNGQTVGRRGVQGIGKSEGFATDNSMQAMFNTGAIQHNLIAGIDYSTTDWTHDRDLAASVAPILNIFDPEPRNPANIGAGLTPQVYTATQNDQAGVYLQNTMSLGGLRLTLAGRQDWAYDETINTRNGQRYATDTQDFTWRAGAVYLFDNGLAPYVSYATSFQPVTADPTSNIVANTAFKPMTGEQYEGGLRFQPAGSNAYFTLSGFQIKQQNVLSALGGQTCGAANVTCYAQTGEARFRGVEFEAKVATKIGLTMFGSVTHNWTKITESTIAAERGNDYMGVPNWIASAFVDYRFAGALTGVGLGGGVRYTGKSFGNNTNSIAIPDYTLFDLFARYEFGKNGGSLEGLSLSVNARNLFDKQYVATCNAVAACYYGSGRAVTARLQYRW